jgi:hypothetical protein
MTQNSTQPTRTQMPSVACPNTLSVETVGQLSNHSLYPATCLSQPARPRVRLSNTRLGWCNQVQAFGAQLFPQVRTPVVPIPKCPATSRRQQILCRLKVVQIGRIGAILKIKIAEIIRPEHVEHFKFFETVCRSRGYQLSVFQDKDEALAWLLA